MIERSGRQNLTGLQFSENSLESLKAPFFNDKIFLRTLRNDKTISCLASLLVLYFSGLKMRQSLIKPEAIFDNNASIFITYHFFGAVAGAGQVKKQCLNRQGLPVPFAPFKNLVVLRLRSSKTSTAPACIALMRYREVRPETTKPVTHSRYRLRRYNLVFPRN